MRIFRIIFGSIFLLTTIILICDYTVFEFFNMKLLPDYAVITAFVQTISMFIFVALVKFNGIIKICLCFFQLIIFVITALFTGIYEYRYTDLNNEKTVEICYSSSMKGGTISYHYRVVNTFFREFEEMAIADYGRLSEQAGSVFSHEPIEIIYSE